jgi:hypothetical protein
LAPEAMIQAFSITLSVPQLDVRADDYVRDVAHNLAGVPVRRQLDPTHLTLVVEIGSEDPALLLLRAVDAVRTAIPQAVVLEANPDLLPLTTIAEYVGLPHRSLERLRDEYPESFPREAIPAGGLWHFAHILRWVRAVGAIHVDTSVLDVAIACERFNAELRSHRPWRVA